MAFKTPILHKHKKSTKSTLFVEKENQMINYNTVQEIYTRNFGSETLYKRSYCDTLAYTEGIMDFQKTLSAFWLVDNIVSYMPQIISNFQKYAQTIYFIDVKLRQDKSGVIEIYFEDYIDGVYHEHFKVLRQEISFMDLPIQTDAKITTYKFFLSLNRFEPLQFVLLLPSEY